MYKIINRNINCIIYSMFLIINYTKVLTQFVVVFGVRQYLAKWAVEMD